VGLAPFKDYAAPSPTGVHDLPDDVRRHHAGAQSPEPSRNGSGSLPTSSSHSCGPCSCTTPWPIGSGDSEVDPEPGRLDFAGAPSSTSPRGVSALAAAPRRRKRKGFGMDTWLPQPPMTVLGAAILWFGWFGFNAAARSPRASCRPRPSSRPHRRAAATLSWTLAEWFHRGGSPTVLGRRPVCVAGLVAITPASGFVMPLAALAIGGRCGRDLLRRRHAQGEARIRRLARRRRRPLRCRRNPGSPGHGIFATSR